MPAADGSARMLLPRAGLAGSGAMGVVRDTRRRTLSEAQRFNHFPTSPYCALSICFEGETLIVDRTSGERQRLPHLMVSGPTREPVTSWNPGPCLVLTVGFYPDAFQAITGLDAAPLFDTYLEAEQVLPGPVAQMMRQARETGSAEAAFLLFEDRLGPLWQVHRPRNGVAPFWFADWAGALAMRAALSAPGKSLRQLQRRIKTWSGQTQRDLARHARVEALFAEVIGLDDSERDYAALAQAAGYADQSHMGREVRRMTGASPARIIRQIETEESYWFYRLLGDYLS